MDTRKRILARDKGLCRCSLCRNSSKPLVATQVDHEIPLWEGGADDDSNLQAINVDCHKRKSAAEADRRAAAQFSVPQDAATPLDFLIGVMKDVDQDPRLRVRAAIAAAQYKHVKLADGGKKNERQNAAGRVAAGKFAPAAPPRLVVNNAK